MISNAFNLKTFVIKMPYEIKWTNYFKVFCTLEDLSQHESKYWENLLWEWRYVINFFNLEFELHILCYDDWEDIWTDCYLDYKWYPCCDWQWNWNVFETLWTLVDKLNEITYYLHKNEWLILWLSREH